MPDAPRPSGRHFLQIPGPTNVPDRVLRAIDRPTIDHRGPEFAALTKAILPPLRAVFIRAPWVEEAGPGVEVLARVSTAPAADRIVAVREGAVLATSFHPELGSDLRVHGTFVRMVRAAAA